MHLDVLRRLLLGLFVAAGTAFAAVPTPPDEDSLRLDGVAQGLKDEALRLNRDLQALEDQLLFPNHSRTSVYVAVKISGFMLQEITVAVDDREPITYKYSDSEQRAFLHKGYHRLQRLSLPPGGHRLRAEFSGRFFDAPKNTGPLKGKLETIFDKGPRELDLVLPISRNSRLDRPGLPEIARLESQKKRQNRNVWLPEPEQVEQDASSFEPGSAADPRYAYALFNRWDGRYFSGLLELHAIMRTARDPEGLPDEFWWLLADCYLFFGMEKPAQDMYRQLAAQTGDTEGAARARLRVAEFEYERGYYANATNTLRRAREKLPPAVLPEWQDSLVQVLLAQGRYNEAVEVLSEAKDPNTLPLHQRYNLGVALINDGKIAAGRSVLDRVGISTPVDEESLAIRDKANLTLAYHFLQEQQGATAKPIFERVRVDGPFSNRALLGMGWAEIAPKGSQQERGLVDETRQPALSNRASLGALLRPGYIDADVNKRLGNRPFRQGKLAKDAEQQLRRALVPWTELANRDPMDPAVQEGLLAIPYALGRLNDHEQALTLYNRAIATLEEGRRRIDAAQKAIQQGRMVETIVRRDIDSETGWLWKLRDLPDTPETFYLQSLLAEHRFQEALKNYRDLRFLGRNLDGWRTRLNNFSIQYTSVERPSVTPEALFESAVDGWEPPWGQLKLALREEPGLAAPGAYDAQLPVPNPWWVDIHAAEVPSRFDGIPERIPWLRARLDALRPLLQTASGQQSQNLQKVALAELDGQRTTIDRYLVEARFAVARLYDRNLKDGSEPAPAKPKAGSPDEP